MDEQTSNYIAVRVSRTYRISRSSWLSGEVYRVDTVREYRKLHFLDPADIAGIAVNNRPICARGHRR